MLEFLHLNDTGAWVLLSFLLFCTVAFRLGKGPILGKLDARIEEIRKEIASAESLRIEAQELLAQYQRKQRDAMKEAQAIVANAQKQADEIGRKAEEDLKITMLRREQQLADRLKRMEEAAINEIRAYAAELAVKATAEIIAEKMDQTANGNLVNQSIDRLAGQIN